MNFESIWGKSLLFLFFLYGFRIAYASSPSGYVEVRHTDYQTLPGQGTLNHKGLDKQLSEKAFHFLAYIDIKKYIKKKKRSLKNTFYVIAKASETSFLVECCSFSFYRFYTYNKPHYANSIRGSPVC